MSEVWFYHLERSSVEAVLPELLTKALERNLRALVVSPEPERAASLDQQLWTYRDDSFLPHGLSTAPHAAEQPVLLSDTEANVNAAQLLVCLDGHEPQSLNAFDRVLVLFDGGSELAVERARALWQRVKRDGASASYWRQAPDGRWEKKA